MAESMYSHDSIMGEVLDMLRNNGYEYVEFNKYDADDNSGYLIVQGTDVTEPLVRYEINGDGLVTSHTKGSLPELKTS